MSNTVHTIVVIDRSSSMENIYPTALEALNEQLSTAKLSPIPVKFSLVTFDHEIEVRYWDKTATKIRAFTKDDYVLRGSTAMYDAVGITVDHLTLFDKIKPEDNYLIVVISDGQENASALYGSVAGGSAQLAQRVQALPANVLVSYVGANQDLAKVAAATGIKQSNTQVWHNTVAGTNSMSNLVSRSSTGYYTAAAAGVASNTDFFGENGLADPLDKKA